MLQISHWIQASRPKTLMAVMAPVLIGTALAIADQAFHPIIAFLCLLVGLFIQIGTNFANDYYDFIKGADTEERIGPTRAVQAGLIEPETMKKAFLSVFALAIFVSLLLVIRGGWGMLLLGIISCSFGFLYTGGPKPLAYSGLGDIFVIVFFGPVAVCTTYYLQALTISSEAVWMGFACGLLSTAILVANNLRDEKTDTQANKKTLIVRFGKVFGKIEYLSCFLIALLIPLFLITQSQKSLLAYSYLLGIFVMIKPLKTVFSSSDPHQLAPVLGATGKSLFIYSLLFSVGWLIS